MDHRINLSYRGKCSRTQRVVLEAPSNKGQQRGLCDCYHFNRIDPQQPFPNIPGPFQYSNVSAVFFCIFSLRNKCIGKWLFLPSQGRLSKNLVQDSQDLFLRVILFLLIIFVYWACVGTGLHAKVSRQYVGVGSLLLPCGSQGTNAGHWAWYQTNTLIH